MNVLVLHLVSVLLLAVVVEVACRLGRFRSAICHALWLVVLMKLIVPPVVAWPVNTQVLEYFAWDSPSPNRDPIDATRQSTRQAESTLRGEYGVYRDGEAFTILIPHSESSISWMMVVGFLWGGGGFVSLVRIVREVSRAKKRIAAGEALPEWLQAQLAQFCSILGVPVPRAVIVREVGGVYMQITGRPTLVISAEALEHVGAELWHTILTHELSHLKRRDHWVAWLLLAAGVVWWWNPCFWWVRNRIHLFSEMACDAWVVNVHPGDRKQYAETMVRIMAMLSRQDAPAPAMGLAAWSAATQERRLWMIMKAKGACNVPWRHAVALSALAMLAAPSWLAVGAGEDTKPVATTDETVGAEEGPKPAATTDETVGAEEGPKPVTTPAGTVGAEVGSKPVTTPAGTVDAAEVAEVAPVSAAWALALPPSDMVQKILDNPVNIEFEDIHINDVFEFIQDSFDLSVVVDQRIVKPDLREKTKPALVPGEPVAESAPIVVATPVGDGPLGGKSYTTDGVVPYINLEDTPLKEALMALLKPLRLTHQIRGHAVWVSTPEQLALDQTIDLPSAGFSEGAILDRLQSPINIEFESIHLQEIVEFMQDSFEINIVVDGQVIMPEGKDWNAPPLGSPGYATDGWVRYIDLTDIPMGEALYHVTRLLNLTYGITKDYVYISTPERVAEFMRAAE